LSSPEAKVESAFRGKVNFGAALFSIGWVAPFGVDLFSSAVSPACGSFSPNGAAKR